MTSRPTPGTTVLGFPRIGPRRELEKALERHWAGTLDAARIVGAAPERFTDLGLEPLDEMFAMARHAIHAGRPRALDAVREALDLGIRTRPVLLGPVTFLLPAEPAAGAPASFRPLDLLEPPRCSAGGAVQISTSCSLLHVPYDLDAETGLVPAVAARLAFARQKVAEVVTLGRALRGGDPLPAATWTTPATSSGCARRSPGWCTASRSATTWCRTSPSTSTGSPPPGSAGCSPTAAGARAPADPARRRPAPPGADPVARSVYAQR